MLLSVRELAAVGDAYLSEGLLGKLPLSLTTILPLEMQREKRRPVFAPY